MEEVIKTLKLAIADMKRAQALHNQGRLDAAKAARKSCQVSIDRVFDLDEDVHLDTEDQGTVERLWEEFYDLQSTVQYQATGHYYSAQ